MTTQARTYAHTVDRDVHAYTPVRERVTGEQTGAGMQDYGFRLYSPAIGRFLSVDPLSPSYPMLTPYQFASNTPIWAVDMDGLEMITYDMVSRDPGINAIKNPTDREVARDLYRDQMASYAGAAALGIAIPLAVESLSMYTAWALLNPVKALNGAVGLSALTIGFVDEGNQVNLPGPIDDVGRATRAGTKLFGNLATSRGLLDGAEDLTVIVAKSGDESMRYLDYMGAEAAYMAEAGEAGTVLVRENAPASALIEEALHHVQRQQHGDEFFLANRALLEVEAQEILMDIGKREGWSVDEISRLESARVEWQKMLDETE